MTTPPPKDMADQTPADTVDCDLMQTFFWQDFGGFDYVRAFNGQAHKEEFLDMRKDFPGKHRTSVLFQAVTVVK